MTIERRATLAAPQQRAEGDNRVGGYAVVWGDRADIGGWWTEEFKPGAFADSIKGDVRALFDHDTGRVLGRTASGTLRLAEDQRGVGFEIDLPDTQDGRDVNTLIGRGDLSGVSFGFRALIEEWDETVDPPHRTISKAEMFELSVVAFPAYDATEVAQRSSEQVRDDRKRHRSEHNRSAAEQRIALRKAEQDQKFRGIRPDPRD